MKLLVENLSSFKNRDLVPAECKNCKKTYYIQYNTVCRILKGSRSSNFCSAKCSKAFLKCKQIIQCLVCNVTIERVKSQIGYNNFCSRKCYFIHKKKPNIKSCLGCKGPFIKKSNAKFCTLLCRNDFKRNIKLQKWLSGELIIPRIYSGSFIRNYLLSISNYKCSICSWGTINSVTGVCPLDVDHIDGNYSNNNITNLRVLCPNCHSLTPTYKSLNIGRGRPNRRLKQV